MSATNERMALTADQLNPTDRAILDELQDGRCTPAYVAEKHGYTAGNVRNRMTNLSQHEHVQALGGGLYDLVDDPRTDTPEQAADSVGSESESQPDLDVSKLQSSLRAAKSALSGSPPDVDTALAEVDAALEVLEDG